MKITDNELLDAIWEQQLRSIASDVLHRYMGGGIGLCDTGETWYRYSCDLHIRCRENLTKKIGGKQLLTRIKKLARYNQIETLMSTKNHSVLTYMIECPASREAFETSRNFWLEKGVPDDSNDKGRNTTKDVDYKALIPECEELLLNKFKCAILYSHVSQE